MILLSFKRLALLFRKALLSAQSPALVIGPTGDRNFCVVDYDDLLIIESYWRWPFKNLEGNAIDFFVLVESMSFADAMAGSMHAA